MEQQGAGMSQRLKIFGGGTEQTGLLHHYPAGEGSQRQQRQDVGDTEAPWL